MICFKHFWLFFSFLIFANNEKDHNIYKEIESKEIYSKLNEGQVVELVEGEITNDLGELYHSNMFINFTFNHLNRK